MLFAWDITIPANTQETTAVKQDLQVTHGVITKISIKFPAGCHGLVKVRLLHFETPLVPLNKDTWVTGDDKDVETIMYYELLESPYQLKFIGVSPATLYEHRISVRIEVLPEEYAGTKPLLDMMRKLYKAIMGVEP